MGRGEQARKTVRKKKTPTDTSKIDNICLKLNNRHHVQVKT